MVAQAAPLLEPGTPGWAQRFALRLQGWFWPVEPTRPMRLQAIVKAELPPAADWPQCLVYVSDVKKLGVSDGAAWRDSAGGLI